MRLQFLCGFALTGAPPLLAQSSEHQVTVASADGFALAARYYAAAGPGPGVLLLHQCNRQGPATGFESLARALAGAGIHVLVLDFRGFGQSTDARFRSYREQMAAIEPHFPKDVERAADFLASRPAVESKRLAVVGASCGGWQAVLLAARRAEVRTVVLLSGAFQESTQAGAQLELIADRPLLVIFSEEDGFGTPASMRAAFAASRHPATRLLMYKGRHHGTPLLAHHPGLQDAVVQWLRQQL